SPPPVPPAASDPHPAGAMPDPGSGDPHRVNVGGDDVCTWHPDILDTVPAPVTRLPDVAGARRSGRGDADHDTDAGEAGSAGEHQNRGAQKEKGRASAHRRVPGKGFACPEQSNERGRVSALTAVNNFPLFVFRKRTPMPLPPRPA